MSWRWLVPPGVSFNPYFSHPFYCIGEMICPDCATRKRVPLARGATHSDRSFRRFATTWCEKSGLKDH